MTTTDRLLPGTGRDLGAFLARLVRLQPEAPVRLQLRGDRLTAWGAPLRLVVRRDVRVPTPDLQAAWDTTVDATALLAGIDAALAGGPVVLPPADEGAWQVGLPPGGGWSTLDDVPASVVTRLAQLAAQAVHTAADPAAAGDVVLDQTVLTVTGGGGRIELPGRVVTALQRMAFVPAVDEGGAGPGGTPANVVRVASTPAWGRVQAAYGSVYLRRPGARLTVL